MIAQGLVEPGICNPPHRWKHLIKEGTHDMTRGLGFDQEVFEAVGEQGDL
jgi:hypothetical protein